MKFISNIVMLAVLVFNNLSVLPLAFPSRQASLVGLAATPTVLVASEPTQTPTETALPITETPTPAETSLPPTETPTPTETALPPTETRAQAVTDQTGKSLPIILLTANPAFITPGEQITVEWQLSGAELSGLDLVFVFPKSVTLKNDGKLALISQVNDANQVYSIPAQEKGALHLQVDPQADIPVLVKAYLQPGNTGLETAAALASNYIALLTKTELDQKGGQAVGLNGKVKVTFPQGALLEAANIFIHHPLPESMPPHSLSGQPIEITAKRVNAKKANLPNTLSAGQSVNESEEISTFGVPVEIEISYADYNIPAELENDLSIYWYDPNLDSWVSLLTSVDRENKLLYAETSHFTVFDFNVDNWQASHLPTVDAFQVSSFTGAATYALPIEVPSGPGGLKPDLALSYNSQIVDSATTLTQASWVGMGWSLDNGGIERNSNGTPTYTGDDTFMLTVNGVSSNIVFDGSAYHLSDENFWKVEKIPATNSWQVTDKSGNIYYFEKVTSLHYYPETDDCRLSSLEARWSLTRMRNIYGQEIKYNYVDENKQLTVPELFYNQNQQRYVCRGTTQYEPANTATYMESIEYANNHYRVRFVREDRSDYNAAWVTDASNHTFERTRLKEIWVEYDDPDLAGAYETTIRKYSLEYFLNTESANLVFPGVSWSAGGKTTTLKKITQYDGSNNALPAYEFSYVDGDTNSVASDDNLHLKNVKNGMGGEVTFAYQRWGLPAGSYPGYASQYHTIAYYYGKPSMPCRTTSALFVPRIPPGGAVDCADNGGTVDEMIVTSGQVIQRDLARDFIKPGGLYRLWASVSAEGTSAIDLGVYDGTAQDKFISGTAGVIELSTHANRADALIRETGTGKTHVYKYKFELLTSGWRVTTKTASAGTQQNTYSYAYTGEAVNTHANTAASLLCVDPDPFSTDPATCFEYVPEYSEFRGHSQVIETAPNGQQTVTSYNQDYLQKGKPITVAVQTNSARILSQTNYLYGAVSYPNIIQPCREDCHVGDCFYHGITWNWTFLDTVENRVYDSSGAYSATLQDFDYDVTNGNQTLATSKSWNAASASWTNFKKVETNYGRVQKS